MKQMREVKKLERKRCLVVRVRALVLIDQRLAFGWASSAVPGFLFLIGVVIYGSRYSNFDSNNFIQSNAACAVQCLIEAENCVFWWDYLVIVPTHLQYWEFYRLVRSSVLMRVV
jgi:hypothetical protein